MPAINKTSLGLNQWLGNEYPKRIDFVEDNKIIDDELIKRVKYTDIATDTTAGIVKFGTETGNAIDAETWKQAIGHSLGGYVSKVESKEAGKWYINDLTDGKIYKCIQTHTSTSFDITKFVDITNVGLSDKVEKLSEIEVANLGIAATQAIVVKQGKICTLSVDSASSFIGKGYGEILAYIPGKFRPAYLVAASTSIDGAIHIYPSGEIISRIPDRITGAIYFNVSYVTT